MLIGLKTSKHFISTLLSYLKYQTIFKLHQLLLLVMLFEAQTLSCAQQQPIHSHKSRQIQITKNTQTHKHASITHNRELQPRDSEKTTNQHNRVNVYTWFFAIVDTIPNTRLKNENGLRYSYAYFQIRVLLFDDEPSKDDTTNANITMSC